VTPLRADKADGGVLLDEALVKKLQLKPGMRVMVLNAPAGYLDRLAPLPSGAELVDHGPADWVQVFAQNKAEVDALAPVGIEAVKREGVLWLCYPKGGPKAGTDINRDKGWDVVLAAGWGPVASAAIDDRWTALRWRPEADVQRKSGSLFAREQQ
jgi:hypothetical protein